jgi:hypothetical protein
MRKAARHAPVSICISWATINHKKCCPRVSSDALRPSSRRRKITLPGLPNRIIEKLCGKVPATQTVELPGHPDHALIVSGSRPQPRIHIPPNRLAPKRAIENLVQMLNLYHGTFLSVRSMSSQFATCEPITGEPRADEKGAKYVPKN